ncbi:kelch repeat-containing protein [Chryseolinea sp. H1M3-3]|uniref:Kelch repeat-containing protein n=1 Tax=Chryseolinea sp. H1M3-3 TaxID=3034144 RepID=UPI0023ED2FF6|nr:kelch repeat-containing protein [Chryseolinea sp. H1M3-3]
MKYDFSFLFSREEGVCQISLVLALSLALILPGCSDSEVDSSARKNVWTRMSDFPGEARFEAQSFTINGKGYLVGGYSSNQYNHYTSYRDVWEYNPDSDEWTRKNDVPGIFAIMKISVIDTKAYVFTQSTVQFWMYDPFNDTWTRKADFPGGYRSSTSTFTIGGKMYVTCGREKIGPTYYNDAWEYDPVTDAWTQLADLLFGARYFSLACATSQHGYLAYGYYNIDTLNEFLEYDPKIDTWKEKTPVPFPSFVFSSQTANAVTINDKPFIQSISSENSKTLQLFEYDPAGDKWQQMSSLTYEYNGGMTMFSIQSFGYLVGGTIPNSHIFSNQVWRYEY